MCRQAQNMGRNGGCEIPPRPVADGINNLQPVLMLISRLILLFLPK
jgi:hypothetical protein